MNLRKSVGNPNSRLNRIRQYLSTNGPRTKRDILRDVFNKTIGVSRYGYSPVTGWKKVTPDVVTIGWGSYVFNLAVKYGYLQKVRKNRTTYWSVNPSIISTK